MINHDGDGRIDVRGGVDTDADGRPDTRLLPDRTELMFAVDADRDGFADLVIEIGSDAVAHRYPLGPGVTDPLAAACYAVDHTGNADPSGFDAENW